MAASDSFGFPLTHEVMSARNAFAITPSDANELAYVTRFISVKPDSGTTLDVALVTLNGDEVTATLAAGHLHPIRAKKVKAAGTGSGDIVGWY